MPSTLARSDSLLLLPGTCHRPEDKPKALAAQWVAQPLGPAGQGVGRSLGLGAWGLVRDGPAQPVGPDVPLSPEIGLCWNLRSLPWYAQANPDTFFPRCYSLCTESEKQAFLGKCWRPVCQETCRTSVHPC